MKFPRRINADCGLRIADFKRAFLTAIIILVAALAAGARAQEVPLTSPMRQARETDQVLRKLSDAPALVHAALTSTTAAVATTSATTSTAGRPLLLKNRRHPTSATLILRRAPMVPLVLAATSATLAGAPAPPPIPDLARLLTAPVAPLTTATVTPASEIPRLDLAWIGPRRYPPVPTPAAAAPTGVVRINTAGMAELRATLKLDAARARNIIQFRTTHGPFKQPEDLAQVDGITEDMVKQWDDADVLIY